MLARETALKLRVLAILAAFLVGLAPASALAAAGTPITDEWIFVGDSITRVTMVSGSTSFSTLVNHVLLPDRQVKEYNAGAIGMTTSRGLSQVKNAMRQHPNAKYVVISLGTNDTDAYLDGSGQTVCEKTADEFYRDYAAMINAVVANDRIPVVPTIPSARNDYCGNIYNGVIRSLPGKFPTLIPGPDLWTHFWVGPCADGTFTHECRTDEQKAWFPEIHPSTSGAEEFRRVWANEMLARVYGHPVTP